MKKIILIAFLFLSIKNVSAQELTWYNDINLAMSAANKEHKPILMFFTGSDWCVWCHRLQDEVFKQPDFIKWAKDSVILMEVDFPRQNNLPAQIQNQNNHLKQEFGITGFPIVWFVNASKKDSDIVYDKIGSTGYLAGGPSVWIKAAKDILMKKK